MADSEVIGDTGDIKFTTRKSAPDDFTVIMADGLAKANYKKYFIMFFVFILISSDVFIEHVLARFTGATDETNRYATSKGVLTQSIVFILLVVLLDILDSNDLI